MYKCPKCEINGVPRNAKYFASSLYPYACTECGALVGTKNYWSGSFAATAEALIIIPLIVTKAIPTLFGGILLLLVFSGGSLIAGSFNQIKEIEKGDIFTSRIVIGILSTFVVFGTLFNE